MLAAHVEEELKIRRDRLAQLRREDRTREELKIRRDRLGELKRDDRNRQGPFRADAVSGPADSSDFA